MAQLVKNPPAMCKTWIRSLGWEDPLEKGMATHSSILAWRIPCTEEPGRLQSMGLQRIRLSDFHFWWFSYISLRRLGFDEIILENTIRTVIYWMLITHFSRGMKSVS